MHSLVDPKLWLTLNFPTDEQSLAQTIERFQLSGFPLMIGCVCELAFQYAYVNGIQGFSEETQLAGWKWLQGFLSWHPQITLKKACNLSIARAMGANPTFIGSWFTLLEKNKENSWHYISRLNLVRRWNGCTECAKGGKSIRVEKHPLFWTSLCWTRRDIYHFVLHKHSRECCASHGTS